MAATCEPWDSFDASLLFVFDSGAALSSSVSTVWDWEMEVDFARAEGAFGVEDLRRWSKSCSRVDLVEAAIGVSMTAQVIVYTGDQRERMS